MDMNRLISMLTRMFVRSAVKTGVDYAARKGKPEAELTPEERKQAQTAKAMADKAQKASRLARRFLR
jgi:flagellar motility protein MotE (MotC chaperone)